MTEQWNSAITMFSEISWSTKLFRKVSWVTMIEKQMNFACEIYHKGKKGEQIRREDINVAGNHKINPDGKITEKFYCVFSTSVFHSSCFDIQ